MRRTLAAAAIVGLFITTGCGAATGGEEGGGGKDGAGTSETGDTGDFTTRTVPHATFETPEDWTGGDDGATHMVGSAVVEDYAIYQNKDKSAAIEYESFKPPANVPGDDVIKGAIDQGLQAQRAASKDQVLFMRETAGHGCLKDGPFDYVEKPVTKQLKHSYGLRYGYTCTSQYGPIRGYSITSYDAAARKHSVTVTALKKYWDAHPDEMQTVIDSWDSTGK